MDPAAARVVVWREGATEEEAPAALLRELDGRFRVRRSASCAADVLLPGLRTVAFVVVTAEAATFAFSREASARRVLAAARQFRNCFVLAVRGERGGAEALSRAQNEVHDAVLAAAAGGTAAYACVPRFVLVPDAREAALSVQRLAGIFTPAREEAMGRMTAALRASASTGRDARAAVLRAVPGVPRAGEADLLLDVYGTVAAACLAGPGDVLARTPCSRDTALALGDFFTQQQDD